MYERNMKLALNIKNYKAEEMITNKFFNITCDSKMLIFSINNDQS